MVEYYKVADLIFSLEYEDANSPFKEVSEKFGSIKVGESSPQIRFIWCEKLPQITFPATRFGKSVVFDRGCCLKSKFHENFMISVQEKDVWQVFVTAPRTRVLYRIVHFFKKFLKYKLFYGCTSREMRAKKIIYSIFESVLLAWFSGHKKSLIHCSTVAKEGKAFVFPAWEGVGKTPLMSYFLKAGWNYLCDDIAILSADGTLNYFPLPMHIYGYHKIVCKDMYDRLTGSLKGTDRMIWKSVVKLFALDKMSRWARAEDIYTSERISHQAALSHVIHMQRNDSDEKIKFLPGSPENLARYTTNTIINEVPLLQVLSSNTNALSIDSFIPGFSQVTNALETTNAKAFATGTCHELIMGKDTKPEEVWEFLKKEFPEELA